MRGAICRVPGLFVHQGDDRVDDQRLLAGRHCREVRYVHVDENAADRPGDKAPDWGTGVLHPRSDRSPEVRTYADVRRFRRDPVRLVMEDLVRVLHSFTEATECRLEALVLRLVRYFAPGDQRRISVLVLPADEDHNPELLAVLDQRNEVREVAILLPGQRGNARITWVGLAAVPRQEVAEALVLEVERDGDVPLGPRHSGDDSTGVSLRCIHLSIAFL